MAGHRYIPTGAYGQKCTIAPLKSASLLEFFRSARYFSWNGVSKPKSVKSVVDATPAFGRSKLRRTGPHTASDTHTGDGTAGRGASFEEVADILGNSPDIVRQHYAKCGHRHGMPVDKHMGAGPHRRNLRIEGNNTLQFNDLGTIWAQTHILP